MYKLGQFNKLKISREVEFGAFLTDDEGNDILLPGSQVPSGARPDDMIDVFIYNDSEDRPVATTKKPKGCVGDIVGLEVVDVNSIGAFLDWGLEKDLFLPFKHQKRRIQLRVFDKVLVKIVHDIVSNRLIASMRIMTLFNPLESSLKTGDSISFKIVEKHERGYVVLINDLYQGMLFDSDVSGILDVGDTKNGFIKNIRDDDKIDVSLRPVGTKAVMDDKQLIMAKLTESRNGFLPFNSKTSAEALRYEFDLSKKAFKKAIGALYKERKITITDEGIQLVK